MPRTAEDIKDDFDNALMTVQALTERIRDGGENRDDMSGFQYSMDGALSMVDHYRDELRDATGEELPETSDEEAGKRAVDRAAKMVEWIDASIAHTDAMRDLEEAEGLGEATEAQRQDVRDKQAEVTYLENELDDL